MAGAYANRFLTRPEKKARREAVVAQFEEGSLRDDQTWENGFLSVEQTRPTFEPLSATQQKALDELLMGADARRLLGALAQLCEARAPSEFDLDTTFSDHEENELWVERANVLYRAMENLK